MIDFSIQPFFDPGHWSKSKLMKGLAGINRVSQPGFKAPFISTDNRYNC